MISGRTDLSEAVLLEGYLKSKGMDLPVEGGSAKPLAFVRTYGCRQNISDGEKIKGILSQMGYDFTGDEEKADIIVFNTCAIREHAEDKVFGNIGDLKKIKRSNPRCKIVICGCMTQQDHIVRKLGKSYSYVDMVLGTNRLHRLPGLIQKLRSENKRIFEVQEDEAVYEDIPVKRDGNTRAWIPVMYGCDNFCSYCVVPFVRGRERSRLPENIIAEARELIEKGYKEINLLGQNVNSYGKNLEEKVNFSELLRRIDKTEGDYQIRFMTSHPKDATRELIDTIAQSKHICRHLHLPFQSGNNRILGLMNRKYTREKYLEIVRYAREKIPELSLTGDVIVGFPGETSEEFADTVSLIKEVGFTSLFTFIYSRREGTAAAKIPDPFSKDFKLKNFEHLLREQEIISNKIYKSMMGKTFKVLIESESCKENGLIARTDGNITVETAGDPQLAGSFARVRITGFGNRMLKGEIL